MDILVLKILIKSKDEPKSWEKLARMLLLKLAGELRYAKKELRLYTKMAKDRPEDAELEQIRQNHFYICIHANNVFQGAKEWWRNYAPTQEKE